MPNLVTIVVMNAKNLQLAKNISWGLAAVTMFLLILGDEQNNALNAATFVLIIAGIIFSALHDKKHKKI
jgi:hypothetical protein